MIGRIISHCEVLEKLGKGGVGVVYKAKDTSTKRIAYLMHRDIYGDNDAFYRASEHWNECSSSLIN